jgi:hypothetical protein
MSRTEYRGGDKYEDRDVEDAHEEVEDEGVSAGEIFPVSHALGVRIEMTMRTSIATL